MAIILNKMTDTGVPATYWKIDSFTLNKEGVSETSVRISYTIVGYFKKDSNVEGSKFLQSLSFSCYGDPNDANLIVYPYINLGWKNELLNTNFSGFDIKALPNYTITLPILCNQIISYCYEDAKTKGFSGGIDDK
jgi:hypothetical protein